MVRSLDPDGEIYFKYDVLGRRIEKEVGSQTTRYYYDGNQVIEERDGADVLQKQYVYGSGVDDILRMDKYAGASSTSYYFHKNAIGSPTAITDGNGNLIERMKYDAFGQATIFDHFTDPSNPVEVDHSVIGNEYLFHARRYDRETNIYYYRARYYDPTIGRFLQTDPMGYQDSMNVYQAFNNNPINFTDPMGLEIDIVYFSAIKDEDRIKASNDIAKTADWGYFFGKTGHSFWNVASLGTLNKVERQKNLGTWGGVLQSTSSAGASISNTVTFGLQDSIYYTQMEEGAGLKSIWKGTKQAAIDFTPIKEIKTIFDSDASFGEKISAFSMTVSKCIGYYVGLKSKSLMKKNNRSHAASAIKRIRNELSNAGFSQRDINSYIRAFDLESIRFGRNLNILKKHYRFFESGKSAGGPWITSKKSLIDASPIMRKIKLALPANNPATGRAWTKIPFGRKVIRGIVAPQPSSFTGLSPIVNTGGVNQLYVMPGPYLKFTIF